MVRARSAVSAKQLALELAELAQTPTQLASESARTLIGAVLAGADAKLIVQAAKLIAEHTPLGYEQPLCAAYTAFATERAHADAGCLVKEALLTALDAVDSSADDLFAAAALYVQRERGRYGSRDSAAGVRARALLALARVGHRDFLPIVGVCLADRDASVRLSAARSIGHRRQRDAAGLLLLRLATTESEPEVVNECWRALFATAPDFARRHAQQLLRGASAEEREQTLLALGAVHDDDAVALLADELEQQPLSEERQRVIEALGLNLRDKARELLLELVRDGSSSDADAALTALAIHRYDARLIEQLRAATAHSKALQRRAQALRLT